MKVKILLILMCSILFLQNCAPTLKIKAVPSQEQKIGYQETITYQKKHFVSLAPYPELEVAKDKTMFMLGIKNCGKEPINISNDNISVIFEDKSKKGASKEIIVQSFDDFMNDLKKEFFNYEKKYINSVLENITVEASSSNSNSVEVKLDDLKNGIKEIREHNQMIQEWLQKFVMKPQSILPGNTFNGIVVCDTRDMNSKAEGIFQVAVSIDDEVYKFTFKRGLLNSKQ